jgi:hypothetical protein
MFCGIQGEAAHGHCRITDAPIDSQMLLFATCPHCSIDTVVTVDQSNQPFLRCQCGISIPRLRRVPGIVYVLSNPKMPGLVKIGFTTLSVEDRVRELNAATGVPAPFCIEAYAGSANPAEHERQIHRDFADRRMVGREFFEISVLEAVEALRAKVGPLAFGPRKQGTASPAVRRFYCGLCKHEWSPALSDGSKCPSCGSAAVVGLSR